MLLNVIVKLGDVPDTAVIIVPAGIFALPTIVIPAIGVLVTDVDVVIILVPAVPALVELAKVAAVDIGDSNALSSGIIAVVGLAPAPYVTVDATLVLPAKYTPGVVVTTSSPISGGFTTIPKPVIVEPTVPVIVGPDGEVNKVGVVVAPASLT